MPDQKTKDYTKQPQKPGQVAEVKGGVSFTRATPARVEEIIGRTPFSLMPREEAKRIKINFSNIVKNKKSIVDLKNWNTTKKRR